MHGSISGICRGNGHRVEDGIVEPLLQYKTEGWMVLLDSCRLNDLMDSPQA